MPRRATAQLRNSSHERVAAVLVCGVELLQGLLDRHQLQVERRFDQRVALERHVELASVDRAVAALVARVEDGSQEGLVIRLAPRQEGQEDDREHAADEDRRDRGVLEHGHLGGGGRRSGGRLVTHKQSRLPMHPDCMRWRSLMRWCSLS